MVFIDDILVYSRSKEEHTNHLRITLQTLKEKQFYSKLKKCEFWLKKVTFLGHVVSKDGISVDPSKVEVLSQWSRLTNAKEVISFLGLPGFSKICRRILKDRDAINPVDKEKCQVFMDTKMREKL